MELLQRALKSLSLDFLYFDNPVSIRYVTGISVSQGVVLWGEKKQGFWVDGRYFSVVRKKSIVPTYLLTQEGFASFLSGKKVRIGFDPSQVSVKTWEQNHQKYPTVDWISFEEALKGLRAVKTAQEKKVLQQAADLSYQGYLHVLEKIKPGVSEKELAWEYEKFCRGKGAEKLAFEPIVAFGENSAIPHWRSSFRKLKKNEVVLLDLGIVWKGYCSDFTRTHFYGKVSPKIKKLYEQVFQAKELATRLARPGCKANKLEEAVRKYFSKEEVEALFLHSLGHGIGLEVHEYPTLSKKANPQVLKKDMVVTIEPGLYLSEEGGVRLEDTFLITSLGAKSLYPKVESPEIA